MIIPDFFRKREQNPEEEYKARLEFGFTNDWSESVTGEFDEEELKRLRDDSPTKLAKYFHLIEEDDSLKPIEAAYEIFTHRNKPKTALYAREYIKLNPEFKEDLEAFFGKKITTELLEDNILKM